MSDDTFATRLKTLRRRANLTQIDLGERSGLGQGQISRLETGQRHYPALETAVALAQALARGRDSSERVLGILSGLSPLPDESKNGKRKSTKNTT